MLVVGRGSNLLVSDDGFDGVAIVLGGDFERIVIDPSTARVRRGRGRGPAGTRTAQREGGDRRTRVLRRYPRQRRWRGAHERRRARRRHRRGDRERRRVRTRRGRSAHSRPPRAGARLPHLRSRNPRASLWARPSPARPTIRRWARLASTRSSAGGASTNRVARTPVRCSRTRPVTPRAGSSRPAVARACASAGPWCRRSTRTSSWPTPGARAADVFALVRTVQRRVAETTGVQLHPELRLIGFAPTEEVGG